MAARAAAEIVAGLGLDLPQAAFEATPAGPARRDPGLAAAPPSESPPEKKAGGLAGLGDLGELQKKIQEERSMLQLYVIKCKQELEEKKETDDKRLKREAEYHHAEFGECCGPGSRLMVEAELGKGVFATVFKCRDTGEGRENVVKEYAVKFIRANSMLRKATEKEVAMYRRLRTEAEEKDPEGARCLIRLAGPETFEHNGHLALVFQLQKCDLRFGLEKYGQGRGLPLSHVRSYARDIFMALRALRKIKVIHSDVKPDNLLMTQDKASLKLSDFGSAMDVGERVRTDYVQPRYYRAPEIILGEVYGTAIDMWSAGATICELATGRILLTGRSNNGMIHEMLKVCAAFPKHVATSGDFAAKHFDAEGGFRLLQPGSGEVEKIVPMERFQKPSRPVLGILEAAVRKPTGTDAAAHQAAVRSLADLIVKCLHVEPAERATPDLALAHRVYQKDPSATP